jgi:hypothetical protein
VIGVKYPRNAKSSCKALWAKLQATNTRVDDDEDDDLAAATPVAKVTKPKATKAKSTKTKVAVKAEDEDIEEEAEDSIAQNSKPVAKKVTARATVKKGVGKATAPVKAAPVKEAIKAGKGRGKTASKSPQVSARITPDLDVKYGEEDVEDEAEYYQVKEKPQTWSADAEEEGDGNTSISAMEGDNELYNGVDEGKSYPMSHHYVSPLPSVRTVAVHNNSVVFTEWDRQQARYHDMPLAAYVEWKLRNPYPFPDTPS